MVSYVLDDLLWDEAFRIMVAKKCFEYYKEQYDDGGAFEKTIEAQIKEVNKKLANIVKAIEMGVINETTQQRMQELELQRNLLTDELAAEQQRKKYDLKLKDITRWLEQFFGDAKDTEKREKLLDLLLDKIYIDSNKLTVVLHYTGDSREFPYKETMELIDGGGGSDFFQ